MIVNLRQLYVVKDTGTSWVFKQSSPRSLNFDDPIAVLNKSHVEIIKHEPSINGKGYQMDLTVKISDGLFEKVFEPYDYIMEKIIVVEGKNPPGDRAIRLSEKLIEVAKNNPDLLTNQELRPLIDQAIRIKNHFRYVNRIHNPDFIRNCSKQDSPSLQQKD